MRPRPLHEYPVATGAVRATRGRLSGFGLALALIGSLMPARAGAETRVCQGTRSAAARECGSPSSARAPFESRILVTSDESLAADSTSVQAADTLEVLPPEAPAESLVAALEEELSDSLRMRLEVGASSDLTNEQFYETDFSDPNFQRRTLVSTPESRMAAVLFAGLDGTRAWRAIGYQLQNQLSLGDKVRHGLLSMQWRHDLDPAWRYHLLPRLEYRHDQTFERDLEEWRAGMGGRLRHQSLDRVWSAELGTNADVLRSSGYGSDLLLDRQTGQVSMSLERVPLAGPEARLGYRLAMRAFPDSVTRDHWEHGFEGRVKRTTLAGHSVLLEVNGARRQTRRIVSTSRDNFWEVDGALEGEARWSEAGALRARLALETMKYDLEDDLLYFNYQLARARVGPRFERGRVTLAPEARGEILFAPLSDGEAYREAGGQIEIEYLVAGSWWSLTPVAGWRDYEETDTGDSLGTAGLHSSYAFYEFQAMVDQALPGSIRARLFASARYEFHVDSAQDARSLYFSFDVRRLF